MTARPSVVAIDAAIEQLTIARAILTQEATDEELELVPGKDFLPEDDRYFLKIVGTEIEVSKDEYVRVERKAGFNNTLGQPDEPATASFSNSQMGVSGRIVYGRRMGLVTQ